MSHQPHATLQAGERETGNVCGRKGPVSTDQQTVEYEPAVCLGDQEDHWHPDLYQK